MDPAGADTEPDVAALLTSLGLPPARSVTRITTGHDATVLRVQTDDRPIAVRLLPAGRDPEPELAALRLATDRAVPVPTVLATGAHGGRPVIVTTWCRGRPIGELLLEGADVEPLGATFGRAHADLHRPGRDGSVLCHLDFQPFNVLVDGDTVTGVVDWTNARLADPRADIATTRVILAFAPAMLPDAHEAIAAFTAAWRRAYGTVRSMPDDAELAPFLRTAAERQHHDWAVRVASGHVPAEVEDAARRIAERVW